MSIVDRLEYYSIIYEILKNKEFQKRKNYKHHGNISVYDHSLAVSKLSYKIAKKLNLDYKSAAIGGLLHDFYKKPWQENIEKQKFLQKHGFTHAKEAMINSHEYFPTLMSPRIDNIIERHMFPLNKIPPKYKEAWVVTFADKYVSLEVFKHPTSLLRFFGIRKKVA